MILIVLCGFETARSGWRKIAYLRKEGFQKGSVSSNVLMSTMPDIYSVIKPPPMAE